MASIEKQVIDTIVEYLNVNRNDITLRSTIKEDLDADELDQIELFGAFEKKFGCEIPEAQVEKLRTVQDLVDFFSSVKK